MNPNPFDEVWLESMLMQHAEPLDDAGFSAAVMQRVNAIPEAAAVAAAAVCLPPSAALSRLSVVTRRDRQHQLWNAAGVLAGAGIGLLALWAQPEAHMAIALVLVSAALPWLLLRDPRF